MNCKGLKKSIAGLKGTLNGATLPYQKYHILSLHIFIYAL